MRKTRVVFFCEFRVLFLTKPIREPLRERKGLLFFCEFFFRERIHKIHPIFLRITDFCEFSLFFQEHAPNSKSSQPVREGKGCFFVCVILLQYHALVFPDGVSAWLLVPLQDGKGWGHKRGI